MNRPKPLSNSPALMVDADWNPIPLPSIRSVAQVKEAKKLDAAVFRAFMGAVYQARKRTERPISTEDAMHLWTRCAGKCEVSGIPFSLGRADQRYARRPWAPSIDQIEAGKGYGLNNARVVCISVNYAMNQWGEDVLYRIATAVAGRR